MFDNYIKIKYYTEIFTVINKNIGPFVRSLTVVSNTMFTYINNLI